MDFPIYFSLEQARAVLPEVKIRVERVIRLNREIAILKSVKIDADEQTIQTELALMELNKKYFKKMHLFYKEVADLTRIGIVLKDVNEGLVDFFSKLDDRDILLCWKYGEKDINFWHEVDAGFAARKSIKLLENYKNRTKF